MAQFSLSPAVTVREINLTGYVPNIPSAKTGAILRSDKGPALDVTAITSENDLVNVFGKPTAANYQDWFQCWNFLQYASSLYVVRPMNKTTKSAAVGMSGKGGSSSLAFSNFFNPAVAEHALENFTGTSETLYFINKEVTSDQRYAVAVCSSAQYFKAPIALEYFAEISETAPGSGSYTVSANGNPTLVTGSQVILNGGKLATVKKISRTAGGVAEITFDRIVASVDVDAFYAKSVSANIVDIDGTFSATFEKANFNLKEGVSIGGSQVVSISNQNNNEYKVTFLVSPTISAGTEYSSSTVNYGATTEYNVETNDFGVKAGATSIKLLQGFVLEAGIEFTLGAVSGTVASVDKANGIVNLVAPFSATVTGALPLDFTIGTPSAIKKVITGINFFDKVYDSGIVQKSKVTVTNAAGDTITTAIQSLVPFNKLFDYVPNWNNEEFCVVILRKNDDGYYERFEQFLCSYKEDARDVNGNKLFVESVLSNGSKAVYGKLGSATSDRVDTAISTLAKIVSVDETVYPVKSGAYDGFGYTQGDIMEAYSLFADPESFDVNIVLCHQNDINYASTIAETRKDCVAIVAPFDYGYLSQNSNNDCTAYLLDNFGTQTEFDDKMFDSFGTYSAIYGNMKYQYDKFNNVNRWVCVAGDVAGLYAQTDSTNDPWFAPAGASRGVIKNAIKLAFNPNKQNRDELYVNGINPIMAIPGEGSAVVWGQKTATATPSAFDRVNVRRLLIHLEKSISTAAELGLFEFNDTFTRTRLFNIIDPFLRSVQSRRGLYAYKVVVDESNNTNSVIDQNGLVIDIYLQPTKVAEFIRVNAIVTPTGSNFSEYVGSF